MLSVTGTENSKQERIHTEPGSNYFFDVSVSFGWIAGRVAIEPVPEEQGRRLVTESKRAETM